MMDVFYPDNITPFAFEAPIAEVWIAGRRRTDATCLECGRGVGAKAGVAIIRFNAQMGDSAYFQYDSAYCQENDLVEIVVRPIGVIWRGTISGRKSDATSLTYTATDLIDKFDNCFFGSDFNYEDEVTKAKKFVWPARQIAAYAYSVYIGWRAANAPTDYPLTIDLATFPVTIPNETRVAGQPLLQGLQQILESIDYRWRIRVDHETDKSVIRAFALGYGEPRSVVRALDPTRAYYDQGGGVATVNAIERVVDASECVTQIYAEGKPHVVETSFLLLRDWDEVIDEFEPPEGHVLKEYNTASEIEAVINNWDKYTTPKADTKRADEAVSKIANPNYRKKYEDICRRFLIPKLDDLYYINDDSEKYPAILGELQRQVKIESDLVQTFNGESLNPFVVYKRTGKDELFATFDGFSIKDSTVVEFTKPFVDTVSNVLYKGGHGEFVPASWDSGTKLSEYVVYDDVDFTTLLTEDQITAGAWLILGEIPAAYKITARLAGELTVQGNLTGAGIEGAAGSNWWITDHDPIVLKATTGAGQTTGKYQINAGGADDIANAHAGEYLVIGAYDGTLGCFTAAPADLKAYKIAYDSAKNLYVDRDDEDLTAYSTNYMILNPRTETFRQYEWVKLCAAFSSLQRLTCFTGPLSTLKNQRVIYKKNEDYEWRTTQRTYLLTPVEGDEDKFTAAYSEDAIDATKDLAALTAWANNEVKGQQNYRIDYTVGLKIFDFSVVPGSRLYDTGIDSGATVTSVKYGFDAAGYGQQITATSWE